MDLCASKCWKDTTIIKSATIDTYLNILFFLFQRKNEKLSFGRQNAKTRLRNFHDRVSKISCTSLRFRLD